MKIKRILCLLLAFLAVSGAASAAEYDGKDGFYGALNEITYQDIAYLPVDNWSNTAIFSVSALGLMKGSYGMFNPYGTVTGTEALAVVLRSAGLEKECAKMYNAVSNQRIKNPGLYNDIDRWADGYMRMAVDKKLITIDEFMSAMDINYPDNSRLFEKDKPVTRATLVIWMVKAMGLPIAEKENLVTDFNDYQYINKAHTLYFETALKNGIISGSNYMLDPYGFITREQLAQIMLNSADLWSEKSGYTVIKGNVDDIVTESKSDGSKILNTTVFKVGDSTFLSQREYKLNGEAVDYTEDTSLKYSDFPVIKERTLPADSSAISKSDYVEVYVKNGKIIAVLEPENGNSEENSDYSEYKDASVYSGKFYIADKTDRTIVLNDGDKLIEIPCFKGAKIYVKNTPVDIETLNREYVDKTIYVFTVKKTEDSVERCYKAQIVDN